MNTTERIAKSVKAAILAVPAQRRLAESNPAWTKAIMKSLSDAGRSLNLSTNGGFGADNRGWLFDHCWLAVKGRDDYDLLGFDLAVECEWLTTDWELQNDFMKLAVSTARVRLMIFQATDVGDAEKKIRAMLDTVASFEQHSPGLYLFAVWLYGEVYEFKFWRVGPGPGELTQD